MEVGKILADSNILGPRTKDSKNNLVPRNPRSQKETDNTALFLMDKFGTTVSYRPIFLKIAWRLDRSTIDILVATAFEKATSNPRGYFIALAKQEENWRD